jgi:hypothetical protein
VPHFKYGLVPFLLLHIIDLDYLVVESGRELPHRPIIVSIHQMSGINT